MNYLLNETLKFCVGGESSMRVLLLGQYAKQVESSSIISKTCQLHLANRSRKMDHVLIQSALESALEVEQVAGGSHRVKSKSCGLLIVQMSSCCLLG